MYVCVCVPVSWRVVQRVSFYPLSPGSHDICGNSPRRRPRTCSVQRNQPAAETRWNRLDTTRCNWLVATMWNRLDTTHCNWLVATTWNVQSRVYNADPAILPIGQRKCWPSHLTCWSTPTASSPEYIMLTQPSLDASTNRAISACNIIQLTHLLTAETTGNQLNFWLSTHSEYRPMELGN